MTALPSWVDMEAWQGYADMRKAMKKPMTPRAEKLVVMTLYALKEKGHDPNAALDQSVVHNWTDVYEPKQKEIANLVKTYSTPEAPMTQDEKIAAEAARKRVMDAIRPAIRLVA